MKFDLEIDHEEGLWFVTSQRLNCFICHRDLATAIITLVRQREQGVNNMVARSELELLQRRLATSEELRTDLVNLLLGRNAEIERLRAALDDMADRLERSWERRDLAPDSDLEAVAHARKLTRGPDEQNVKSED